MCSAPKAPTPVAPPAPIPVRDTDMAARGAAQARAQSAAGSGYSSTIKSDPGGATGAGGTSAVLGG